MPYDPAIYFSTFTQSIRVFRGALLAIAKIWEQPGRTSQVNGDQQIAAHQTTEWGVNHQTLKGGGKRRPTTLSEGQDPDGCAVWLQLWHLSKAAQRRQQGEGQGKKRREISDYQRLGHGRAEWVQHRGFVGRKWNTVLKEIQVSRSTWTLCEYR